MRCGVLLVTVTDVATKAVIEAARLCTNRGYEPLPGKHKTYFDLGIIGGSRVFLVRSEMGSAGVGASLVTITDALAEVKPGIGYYGRNRIRH
ncbi:MAG TPA: hypothetical protein VJX67_16185 [Blastocatellia bacterium]|nr:hypothetical protein [Blastocatellia bacterium]